MDKPALFPPSADNQINDEQVRMVDIGDKAVTRRRAIAQGQIGMASATLRRIIEKTIPKGDVLAVAEVAGVMAAKRVPELLPLCHPLPLDFIQIQCTPEPENGSIRVRCEVRATAKTGVEMEALAGVSAALLSIYDLTKGVDPALTISNIHLQFKEGGKSGSRSRSDQNAALQGLKGAVITISDRCAHGQSEDTSGPLLAHFLRTSGAAVLAHETVPDDRERIKALILDLALERKADLLLTTGGTGLGPKDVTPEALSELRARPIPGIGELLRSKGAGYSPLAWLSRAEAAVVGQTLVIPLPGSLKAVTEGLELLKDLLPHALHITKGGAH